MIQATLGIETDRMKPSCVLFRAPWSAGAVYKGPQPLEKPGDLRVATGADREMRVESDWGRLKRLIPARESPKAAECAFCCPTEEPTFIQLLDEEAGSNPISSVRLSNWAANAGVRRGGERRRDGAGLGERARPHG